MEYIEHRTAQHERWDTIAARYYNNALAYERIQRANPTLPRTPVVPPGVLLRIPVDKTPPQPDPRGLPPWLRF